MPQNQEAERQRLIEKIEKQRLITKIQTQRQSSGQGQQTPVEPLEPYTSPATRIKNAIYAPWQQMAQGASEAKRNPLAGGFDMAAGAIGVPFSALNVASEGWKNVPVVGPSVAGALQVLPWAAGRAVDVVQGGLDWLTNKTLPENIKNVGMNPEHAQQTMEAGNRLNQTIAPFFLPQVGAKMAGGISQGISNVAGGLAGRLEASAMKQSFSGEKGIVPFDRQVKTSLQRYGYSPTRKGFGRVESDLTNLDNTAKSLASRAVNDRGANIDLSEAALDSFIKSEVGKVKNNAAKNEAISAMSDAKARVLEVASQYSEGKVPLTAAIELKSSLQRMAQKYDQFAGINREAYKTMAHKILGDITTQEPQLGPIGRKQRDLIELSGTLQRRVATLEKADLISWRMARAIGLGGGVGFAVGSMPGAVLGAFLEVGLDNPSAKHWVAVTMDRISQLTKQPTSGVNPYRYENTSAHDFNNPAGLLNPPATPIAQYISRSDKTSVVNVPPFIFYGVPSTRGQLLPPAIQLREGMGEGLKVTQGWPPFPSKGKVKKTKQ